ncbi:Uncharacterized protein HZ326_24007 [Fusarium oxysporum f. sp. albedinis]|nr:Uncharacterized protein HZ326_24007 [Fusarium oxysporum f. sp. albedinis]
MTSKSCPLRHAELLLRAAIEAPPATETLPANGPAAVESLAAAVGRVLRRGPGEIWRACENDVEEQQTLHPAM